MSNLTKEKNIFSNNQNNENSQDQDDLSIDNQINTKAKNVKIYDDDDAYMLNFEKDNTDENEVREDVSDLDNYEKIKEKNYKNKSNMNFSEEIDDHEPRKDLKNVNSNIENREKNRKENNLTENIKKGKLNFIKNLFIIKVMNQMKLKVQIIQI